MAKNRHIIKRQLLEIGIADKKQADQIQLQVRKVFQENLLKMMDAILDEVSLPNQLHQIEQLEIDFGEIALNHIDDELSTRFNQQFKKAVLDAIKRQTVQIATFPSQASTSLSQNQKKIGEGKTDIKKGTSRENALQSNIKSIQNGSASIQVPSALELVLYFLQIGRLPWWAKAEDALLDNCIEVLLEEQAALFIKELRPLLENVNYRKRIIGSIQSATRLKLLQSFLSPNIEDFVADSLQKITLLSKETNLPKVRLEWYFWDKALLFAIRTQEQHIWQSMVIETLVTQLLEEENLDQQNLSVLLIKVGFTEMKINPLLNANTIGNVKNLRLLLENVSYRKRLISSTQSATRLKLFQSFFLPTIKDFVESSLQKIALLSKETNLPKARLEWYFWDKVLLFAIRTQEKSIWQSAVIEAFVVQLLEEENLDQQNLKVSLVQSGFTELEIKPLLSTKTDEAESIVKQTTPTSNIRAFSASDKIYIDNAGLVLIWIFLNGFFERMGLVSEKKFVDMQSQHRAVRLLQYLFDASTEVLEYDLGLNKLLCGLSLDTVIEPQDALNETEQNACEELLQGVLEHASGLGNISVDGFRASFFMREGVLSLQDQVWLLQIQQKEAYDILLGRLPWSYQVVKLPWMNKAIYVEW